VPERRPEGDIRKILSSQSGHFGKKGQELVDLSFAEGKAGGSTVPAVQPAVAAQTLKAGEYKFLSR